MANDTDPDSAPGVGIPAAVTPQPPKAAPGEISVAVLAAWMALAPVVMLAIIWLLSLFGR